MSLSELHRNFICFSSSYSRTFDDVRDQRLIKDAISRLIDKSFFSSRYIQTNILCTHGSVLFVWKAPVCLCPLALFVVVHSPDSAVCFYRHSIERCCVVRVPGVSRCIRQPRRSQPRRTESPLRHRQHQQQRQFPQHSHRGRPSLPDLSLPGGRESGLRRRQHRQKRAAAATEAATSPTGQRALPDGQNPADPQRQHTQLHEGIVVVHLGGQAGRIQLAAEEAQTEKLP